MKIRVVVDNVCQAADCGAEHGLSLYVEAGSRRFFFDLGQSDLFVRNARQLGVDVAAADFAVVSHGHYDHGGGIQAFLHANNHAEVMLHRRAFVGCYSQREGRMRYIGLDAALR
ncbi:MAG: MBL fold metallo-hydrolase, partial [Bacteroidaceae bacterium]|nr:MBL fold metallo-hydrolase [Bacteroidaceae bacterium]